MRSIFPIFEESHLLLTYPTQINNTNTALGTFRKLFTFSKFIHSLHDNYNFGIIKYERVF